MPEFREFLRVMDIPLKSEDEAYLLFQEVDQNQDGMISFDELKDMMMRQTFNKLHHERYPNEAPSPLFIFSFFGVVLFLMKQKIFCCAVARGSRMCERIHPHDARQGHSWWF